MHAVDVCTEGKMLNEDGQRRDVTGSWDGDGDEYRVGQRGEAAAHRDVRKDGTGRGIVHEQQEQEIEEGCRLRKAL